LNDSYLGNKKLTNFSIPFSSENESDNESQ